jgi:hypothetical protein
VAVREFNGSSDFIETALGSCGVPIGPLTVIAIIEMLADAVGNHAIVKSRDVNENITCHLATAAGEIRCWNGANTVTSGQSITVSDGWVVAAWVKPAGSSALTGREYTYSSTTWTSSSGPSLDAGSPAATGLAFFGSSTGDFVNCRAAVVGMWDTELSQSQVEDSGLEAALSNWVALDPIGLWRFDQASIATPITDMTGNGADQTSITGTTVVNGDDPPGFSFDLPTQTTFLVPHRVTNRGR